MLEPTSSIEGEDMGKASLMTLGALTGAILLSTFSAQAGTVDLENEQILGECTYDLYEKNKPKNVTAKIVKANKKDRWVDVADYASRADAISAADQLACDRAEVKCEAKVAKKQNPEHWGCKEKRRGPARSRKHLRQAILTCAAVTEDGESEKEFRCAIEGNIPSSRSPRIRQSESVNCAKNEKGSWKWGKYLEEDEGRDDDIVVTYNGCEGRFDIEYRPYDGDDDPVLAVAEE